MYQAYYQMPNHTPTPAILFTFGILDTNIRVDQKQLIYLHKILNRASSHWTKQTLETLEEMNLGWYKAIKETLSLSLES